MLRRDVEVYAAHSLATVVLDEAQHIKNPETQNAQAAFSLSARHRFVLTGTPLENSVRDLWSLMNFVAPGYLGTRSDFRERYEKPLMEGLAAASPDSTLQHRLARRLRPFLLRRRKSDVARELPEKIEQVLPCELGPTQRKTYNALLREIQQGIGPGGASDGATRMKMLTGLLRLRQTCCDLRLLGLPPNEQTDSSAKLDLLDELLGKSSMAGIAFSSSASSSGCSISFGNGSKRTEPHFATSLATRKIDRKKSIASKTTKRFRSSSSA